MSLPTRRILSILALAAVASTSLVAPVAQGDDPVSRLADTHLGDRVFLPNITNQSGDPRPVLSEEGCFFEGELPAENAGIVDTAHGQIWRLAPRSGMEIVEAYVDVEGAERVELVLRVHQPDGIKIVRTPMELRFEKSWRGRALAPAGEFEGYRIEAFICVDGGEPPIDFATTVEPGTIVVNPAIGLFANPVVTIESPPGGSFVEWEFAAYRPNGGDEISGPFPIPRLGDLPGEVVGLNLQPVTQPLLIPFAESIRTVPFPGDRTGFVISVTSPTFLYNPTLNVSFDNSDVAGPVPAPVNLYAYDARVFTIIFPDAALAPGTTFQNFHVTVTGGVPLSQAPPASALVTGNVIPWYKVDGGPGDYGYWAWLFNPTDQDIVVSDRSFDITLVDPATGEPLGASHKLISGTFHPGEFEVLEYLLADDVWSDPALDQVGPDIVDDFDIFDEYIRTRTATIDW